MGIKTTFLIIPLFCFLGWQAFTQDAKPDAGNKDNSSNDVIPLYSAPSEGEPSFRLSETDSGTLFYQRLKWGEGKFAVSYQVILERKRENLDAYTEVMRKNVSEPFLDISVPAGDYRYRVMSFNVLGLMDSQSDWEYFKVIQAYKPTIVDYSPSAFYFDRLTPRIIILSGEHILPDSEIYLANKTVKDENGKPQILKPSEIYSNELGENAQLVFKEEDLIAGKYDIVVINPGGLETRAGIFTIAMAKPFDINVSGGFTPALTLFGQKNNFLDNVFIPLNFSVRGSFVPFKLDIGNFGLELNSGWSYLTSESNKNTTSAHLVFFQAGALYQYWLIKRELSVNGRIGIGMAGVFNYYFVFKDTGNSSTDSYNTMAFSFDLGASVQWLLYKQFFVEGGLDYFHFAHSEIPMGFIRIGLFAGYQF